MNTEITVTVSGPVGCGKSAIAGEIEITMRALGIPVQFADEAAMRSEKNMTHADWTDYLEMYKPRVVIVEKIERLQAKAEMENKYMNKLRKLLLAFVHWRERRTWAAHMRWQRATWRLHSYRVRKVLPEGYLRKGGRNPPPTDERPPPPPPMH